MMLPPCSSLASNSNCFRIVPSAIVRRPFVALAAVLWFHLTRQCDPRRLALNPRRVLVGSLASLDGTPLSPAIPSCPPDFGSMQACLLQNAITCASEEGGPESSGCGIAATASRARFDCSACLRASKTMLNVLVPRGFPSFQIYFDALNTSSG